MIFYVNPLNDLGSFVYSLHSCYSCYLKYNEKISLILPNVLSRFVGIQEFLLSLEFINSVEFYLKPQNDLKNVYYIEHYKYDDFNVPVWMRFYNHIIQTTDLKFDFVQFELKIKKYDIEYKENYEIIADRWNKAHTDRRRKSGILKNSGLFNNEKYFYLDYNLPLLYNLSLIQHNQNILHTTFTGVSVLANMMNKEMIVYWDDEIANWTKNAFNLPQYGITELCKRQFMLSDKITFKKI